MTKLKGYRTLIVNAILGLPLAWDVIWLVLQTPEFQGVIPQDWLPYYSLGMVVVNMYLRKITTTPMGRR